MSNHNGTGCGINRCLTTTEQAVESTDVYPQQNRLWNQPMSNCNGTERRFGTGHGINKFYRKTNINYGQCSVRWGSLTASTSICNSSSSNNCSITSKQRISLAHYSPAHSPYYILNCCNDTHTPSLLRVSASVPLFR